MIMSLVRLVCACMWVVLAGYGYVASANDEVSNVAGTWSVTARGEAGSAKQTIVLKQDGNKLTGTFQGPRQSGTIEGMIDGNKIVFHVNERNALDYKGTVDGDSMKGTLSGRGKSGEWTAAREK